MIIHASGVPWIYPSLSCWSLTASALTLILSRICMLFALLLTCCIPHPPRLLQSSFDSHALTPNIRYACSSLIGFAVYSSVPQSKTIPSNTVSHRFRPPLLRFSRLYVLLRACTPESHGSYKLPHRRDPGLHPLSGCLSVVVSPAYFFFICT